CALIPSHFMPSVRTRDDDDRLWRMVMASQYWRKQCWIFPIHRPGSPGHWVLAYANIHAATIYVFDSFAEEGPWVMEVRV
ncbi:hypothetical protein FISHEDRAFT_30723, partial [Fistulina hepatica ATCC 64428]